MGYAEINGKFPNGKPKYRARWQLPERTEKGRHKEGHEDGFTSADLARQYARDQEAAIRAGTYIDPNAGKITLADYFALWLPAQKLSPGSKDTYRYTFNRVIAPRWGATSLNEIRALPMMQWLNSLNDPESPTRLAKSSLRIVEAVLNGMFELAAYEDRIRKSPIPPKAAGAGRRAEDYKDVREGEVFTRDEFATLLDRMPTWMHVLFCVTKAFTGMRWSENAATCRKDLRLILPDGPDGAIEGTYRIDPRLGAVKRDDKSRSYLGPPKSGGGRLLDLPPFLVLLLADWLTRIPPSREQLFTAARGGLLRYGDYITDIWRPACDGRAAYVSPAGRNAYPAILPACPGKVPHDLKHTNKALMNDRRVHPVIQDYALGHKEPGAQSSYQHPTAEMRRERVRALQETWKEWAIDLTALSAWGAWPGARVVGAIRLPRPGTPELLQAVQSTLF